MGGRMATLLAAQCESHEMISPVPVIGVVCLGYPFYAAGKQHQPRIDHLQAIGKSVLVLQGERDIMGDLATVSGYSLASGVFVHWLPDGNHDLKPRKFSGFSHEDHLQSSTIRIHEFCKVLFRHSTGNAKKAPQAI